MSFVHAHNPNKGKLDLIAVKYIFVGYSSTQKGYKCYHPLSKNSFVSTNVTFNDCESYFPAPYLQGENSIKEDKDQDSYLIDPSAVSSPVFDPAFVPYFSKPESLPLKPTPKNRMTSKVYLRKKVTIPKLIQAQKSEPPSRNEVIVSHPSSQTESKLQSKKSIDQNHPIAIRKGMKDALNVLYIHFHMWCHLKSCLHPIEFSHKFEQYSYSYYSIRGFI